MKQKDLQFTCMLPESVEKLFVGNDLKAAMAEFGPCEYRRWDSYAPPPQDHVLEALAATDVLLTGWNTPRLPLSYLDRPDRRLRYICNVTGSIKSHIPKEYLLRGVVVTNWGDGPMWYLAEGNLALILACTREMPRVRRHMLERPQWNYPFSAPSPTLRRKKVGFVGFGAIAGMLVGLMKPFDCSILVYDPYVDQAGLPPGVTPVGTLEELFSQADVITVQCGLSDETTGMIHRRLLELLKPHAIFINTARGKIVVETDLIAFLRQRPDVFAGLDVYEVEPLPKDSPLPQMENVICYPHSVGAGGEDMYREGSAFAAANIRAFGTHRPLQAVIGPEKYDRIT